MQAAGTILHPGTQGSAPNAEPRSSTTLVRTDHLGELRPEFDTPRHLTENGSRIMDIGWMIRDTNCANCEPDHVMSKRSKRSLCPYVALPYVALGGKRKKFGLGCKIECPKGHTREKRIPSIFCKALLYVVRITFEYQQDGQRFSLGSVGRLLHDWLRVSRTRPRPCTIDTLGGFSLPGHALFSS